MILKYLKYLFQSGNEHSIHSPFVFEFYMNVIKDQTPFYAFNQIEKLRAELLATREKIEVLDLGAGMKQDRTFKWSLKKVVSFMQAVRPSYCSNSNMHEHS